MVNAILSHYGGDPLMFGAFLNGSSQFMRQTNDITTLQRNQVSVCGLWFRFMLDLRHFQSHSAE